jgi:hypothetical protein
MVELYYQILEKLPRLRHSHHQDAAHRSHTAFYRKTEWKRLTDCSNVSQNIEQMTKLARIDSRRTLS